MTDFAVSRTTRSWDLVGVLLSAVCLIHCLAVPVGLALIPALTGTVSEQEWLHQLLVVLAFIVVTIALAKGIRAHRRYGPPLLASAGLALLALSLIVGEDHWAEQLVTGAGALMTASAHLWNRALLKRALAAR